jgi:ubiquinone biosynthesis protein UbiJ
VVVDGRARVVDRLDGPPTVTVTLGSGAFTRLACGRVDPGAMLGEIQLSGDTELGQRIVTSLPYTI